MENRFVRAWREFERRVDGGESPHALVRAAPTRELVALLAAAGAQNALLANIVATELLNRERRAPFFGAFLVGVTMLLLHVTLDYAYTGTPFFLESGARGYILQGSLLLTAVFSFVMFRLWRGGLPGLRARLRPPKDY